MMADWATARRLGLVAVIRPNLGMAVARMLGTRVRDLSERLEKVQRLERVRDFFSETKTQVLV